MTYSQLILKKDTFQGFTTVLLKSSASTALTAGACPTERHIVQAAN